MENPNLQNNYYGPPSNQQIMMQTPNMIPQQMGYPQQKGYPQQIGGIQYIYVQDPMTELESIPSVLIKQEPEIFEAITGCETPNRYHVLGQTPQGLKYLFKCKENSGWFMRNCCPSTQREFDMEINHIVSGNQYDPRFSKKFANAYKPFKCTICCLCRPEIFLTLEGGNSIGTIKHVCTAFDPRFDIYDENNQLRYILTADCCQCGLLCANNFCGKLSEAHFIIVNPGDNREVGRITKKAATYSELVTDADSYIIRFPSNATAKDKLSLIALGLMVDYQYFETDSSGDGNYGRGHRRHRRYRY